MRLLSDKIDQILNNPVSEEGDERHRRDDWAQALTFSLVLNQRCGSSSPASVLSFDLVLEVTRFILPPPMSIHTTLQKPQLFRALDWYIFVSPTTKMFWHRSKDVALRLSTSTTETLEVFAPPTPFSVSCAWIPAFPRDFNKGRLRIGKVEQEFKPLIPPEMNYLTDSVDIGEGSKISKDPTTCSFPGLRKVNYDIIITRRTLEVLILEKDLIVSVDLKTTNVSAVDVSSRRSQLLKAGWRSGDEPTVIAVFESILRGNSRTKTLTAEEIPLIADCMVSHRKCETIQQLGCVALSNGYYKRPSAEPFSDIDKIMMRQAFSAIETHPHFLPIHGNAIQILLILKEFPGFIEYFMQQNAIPILFRVLKHEQVLATTVASCFNIFCTLAKENELARQELSTSEAFEIFFKSLESAEGGQTHAYGIEFAHILFANKDSKGSLMNKKVIEWISKLMRATKSLIAPQESTLELLLNIAKEADNDFKKSFIEAGVLERCLKLMAQNKTVYTLCSIGCSILELFVTDPQAIELLKNEGGIDVMVMVLKEQEQSPIIQIKGISILSALSKEEANKECIETVLTAMTTHATKPEVIQSCFSACAILSGDEENRNSLVAIGGIEAILDGLQAFPACQSLIVEGLKALASLASMTEVCDILTVTRSVERRIPNIHSTTPSKACFVSQSQHGVRIIAEAMKTFKDNIDIQNYGALITSEIADKEKETEENKKKGKETKKQKDQKRNTQKTAQAKATSTIDEINHYHEDDDEEQAEAPTASHFEEEEEEEEEEEYTYSD